MKEAVELLDSILRGLVYILQSLFRLKVQMCSELI